MGQVFTPQSCCRCEEEQPEIKRKPSVQKEVEPGDPYAVVLSSLLSMDLFENDVVERFKHAVNTGDDTLAMCLVQENPTLNLPRTSFAEGETCLQVAVGKSSKLALFLLQQGLPPNTANRKNGDTALHTAVRRGDIQMVALLCQYEANANRALETPLMIAMKRDDLDIIEMLSIGTPILNAMAEYQSKSGSAVEHNINGDHDNELPIRVSNPYVYAFSKLKRGNTLRALEDLRLIIEGQHELPILCGWLLKRRTKMTSSWRKRWVIIKGTHLLWSATKKEIANPKDRRQRNEFGKSFDILSISNIQKVSSSKSSASESRKFSFYACCVGKTHVWKCKTSEDRDSWVDGLLKHQEHMRLLLTFLGNINCSRVNCSRINCC